MTCIQTTAQETSFQRTQKSPTRLNNQQRVYICNFSLHLRQRPYHVENTGSRPITEVKQRRARLVLGWVTAWEHRVQLAFIFFLFERQSVTPLGDFQFAKENYECCYPFTAQLSLTSLR